MGSIKNASNNLSEHELSEAEFNYVMNVNKAKQSIVEEYNRVISAFLTYVATDRLGYKNNNLQFELDFSDKKRTLKVTQL